MYKEKLQEMIWEYRRDPVSLEDIRQSLYVCGEYSNIYFQAEGLIDRYDRMTPEEWSKVVEEARNLREDVYDSAQQGADTLNDLAWDVGLEPIVDAEAQENLFSFCTICAEEIMSKELFASFSMDEYKRDVDTLFPIIDELIHDRGERADELNYEKIAEMFTVDVGRYGELQIDTDKAELFCAEHGLTVDWQNGTLSAIEQKDGKEGKGDNEPDSYGDNGPEYDLYDYDDER